MQFFFVPPPNVSPDLYKFVVSIRKELKVQRAWIHENNQIVIESYKKPIFDTINVDGILYKLINDIDIRHRVKVFKRDP